MCAAYVKHVLSFAGRSTLLDSCGTGCCIVLCLEFGENCRSGCDTSCYLLFLSDHHPPLLSLYPVHLLPNLAVLPSNFLYKLVVHG
jgi:hypothetical protein